MAHADSVAALVPGGTATSLACLPFPLLKLCCLHFRLASRDEVTNFIQFHLSIPSQKNDLITDERSKHFMHTIF